MAKARIAFSITVFYGLTAAVEPLKLEEYVPADFHRRYLSVEPKLAWNRMESESNEGPTGRVTRNNDPFGSLQLRHGSESFTQQRRWEIECGSGLESVSSGFGTRGHYQYGSEIFNTEDYNEYDTFRYSAFTRLSAHQYLSGRFFLSPSAGFDWEHSPISEDSRVSWNLNPASPANDTTRFHRHRTESERNSFGFSGKARLEAGFGRIQDVRFAETGMFILDRIAETTGKPMALDAQGMRDLESAVEARRRQRPFLDFRRAAIYDLETVAAFLQERRGGEALPARTVLEMADEWRYGGMHSRKSGWEAKTYPFLEWTWNQTDGTTDIWSYSKALPGSPDADPDSLARLADAAAGEPRRYRSRNFNAGMNMGAGARIDWHRPWNRFWQFNAMGYGRVTRISREIGDRQKSDSAGIPGYQNYIHYIEFAYPSLETGASFEAAWFPDSRTSLSGILGLSVWRSMDYLGSKAGLINYLGAAPVRETTGMGPSLDLKAEYWLNPRLTATGSALYSFVWNESRGVVDYLPDPPAAPVDQSITAYDLRLNAGLRYYLF